MTTKAPEQSLPPKTGTKKTETKTVKPAASTVLSGLVLMVLEVLLPALVAAGVVWVLFYYFDIWRAAPGMAVTLFGAAVVAIALVITLLVDAPLVAVHKGFRKQGMKPGSGPLARLIRLVLGGLIIPGALVAAVNLVTLPNVGTPMGWLIGASVKPVRVEPPQEVAQMAIDAKDPYRKALSIQVLQGFRSTEALTQLVRIASEDRAALASPSVRSQLAKAIASYGESAKDPLLALFRGIPPSASRDSAAMPGDLYEQYFAGSVESLKESISTDDAAPEAREARQAQAQAIETYLKSTLASEDGASSPADMASADPRLDFVLRTLLAMDMTANDDLLAFAKATAADAQYSSAVRGDALLLVGKLGKQEDIDGLFPYLKDGDELIQTRALQAIAALQSKVNGSEIHNP